MPFEFEANDEWEVVWDGGELLPNRPTKPGELWQAPNRLYNKPDISICEICGGFVYKCKRFGHIDLKRDGNTSPSGGETGVASIEAEAEEE